MMKLSRTTRLLTLLAVLAWSPFALADEAALWSLLQGGGQVVLIRHATPRRLRAWATRRA